MGAFGGGGEVAAGSGKGVGEGREGRRTIVLGEVGEVATPGGAKAEEGRRTIGFREEIWVSAAAAADGGAKPGEGRSEIGNAGGPEKERA